MADADEQKTGEGEGEGTTGGGKGSKATGAGGSTGDDTEKSDVEFTEAQQEKIQDIVDAVYKKAYGKALDKKTSGDSEEVVRLKAELAKKADAEGKKSTPDVEEMRKRIAELEAKDTQNEADKVEIKSARKSERLLMAIAKQPVQDGCHPEIVTLIKDSFAVDGSGALMVQGADGQPKVNVKGEDMSVDEFISSWLKERPHYLKASGGAGAGSGSSKFGEGKEGVIHLATPADVDRIDIDTLRAAMDGDGISVEGAKGQTFKFKTVTNPFAEMKKKRLKKASNT